MNDRRKYVLLLPLFLLFGFCISLSILWQTTEATRMQSQNRAPSDLAETIFSPSPPLEGGSFGRSIDISGTMMAIGAPRTDVAGAAEAGVVYVYERSTITSSDWAQIKVLSRTIPSRYEHFGHDVAVDNHVVVVGSPGITMGLTTGSASQWGGVLVYGRDHGGANNWGTIGGFIEDGIGAFARFGDSVAIDDGIIVVGADGADRNFIQRGAGIVYVYGPDSDGRYTLDAAVFEEDEAGQVNDSFGSDVDIHGTTIIVGAENGDRFELYDNRGAAFVYDIRSGTEVVSRIDSPWGGLFGSAVAIGADYGVIGAFASEAQPGEGVSGTGSVTVIRRSGSNWNLAQDIPNPDPHNYDYFGISVAMDGNTMLVGATGFDVDGVEDAGAVFIYELTDEQTGFELTGMLTASDAGSESNFGREIAVSGETYGVGANLQNNAYVYNEAEDIPEPPSYMQMLPLVLHRRPATTGLLDNNTVVESASGALIGAADGVLDEPVPVFIGVTEPPTNALPANTTAVGASFRFGAGRAVGAPADKPFGIALPVPNSADTNHLAIALLTPFEDINDTVFTEPQWELVQGRYDAVNQLLSIPISYLSMHGLQAVVVENADVSTRSQPSIQATTVLTERVVAEDFNLTCINESPPIELCTLPHRSWIQTELANAYNNYLDLGFLTPALIREEVEFLKRTEAQGGGYNITVHTTERITGIIIRPKSDCQDGDTQNAGSYNFHTKNLTLCIDSTANFTDKLIRTIRHEMFHAVQHAYDNMPKSGNTAAWVIEGSAAAAERSPATMHRTPDYNIPRRIDISLLDNTNTKEYEAQDFWVFFGQATNAPLSIVQPVLQFGGTNQSVADNFGLPANYWAWANNQGYQKQVTLDNFLGAPCTVDYTFNPPTVFNKYKADTHDSGTLRPLSSALVEWQFTQEADDVRVIINASNGVQGTVYVAGEGQCSNIAVGTRALGHIDQGTLIYILLANGHHAADGNWDVRIEAEIKE